MESEPEVAPRLNSCTDNIHSAHSANIDTVLCVGVVPQVPESERLLQV